MTRRLGLAIAFVVAGCAAVGPGAGTPAATPKPAYTMPPPTPLSARQGRRRPHVTGRLARGDDVYGCSGTPSACPRSFAPDRDIGDGYTFTIEFKKHLVADDPPLSLGGYPPELLPELDAAVRRLIGDQIISSELPHAGWLLPPPDDGYLLRYGTDQEGDVRLVVRYDRGADAIISVSQERL